MAQELWQAVQNVPGLEGGDWHQKLASFGQRFYGNQWTGTLEQNTNLLNNINKGIYNPTGAGGTVQTPGTPQPPTSPSEVPNYINTIQDQKFAELAIADSPFKDTINKTDQQISADAKAALQTTTQAPALLNLENTYNQLRSQYKLDDLDKQIGEINTAIDSENLNAQRQRAVEQGKPVALNVMEGRISESDRIANEKLQNLTLIRDSMVRYSNSANSVISTMMSLKQQDYASAKDAYESEYNKNLQFYQIVQNQKQARDDLKYKVLNDEKASATANIQIYMNMIKDGNLNWNQMDDNTRMAINKLEVMSGLGQGFISKIKMDPDKMQQIVGDRVDPHGNKYVDMLITNPDGSKQVQSILLGKVAVASSGSSTAAKSAASAQAAKDKASQDKINKLNADADASIAAMQKGTGGSSWAVEWNKLQSRYGLSNEDTDRALGVPDSWIASGKPGWEWWNNNH